ncbi:MAG: hypothetical protein NVS3B21_01360 [Acidimicrobiales bacterium]
MRKRLWKVADAGNDNPSRSHPSICEHDPVLEAHADPSDDIGLGVEMVERCQRICDERLPREPNGQPRGGIDELERVLAGRRRRRRSSA